MQHGEGVAILLVLPVSMGMDSVKMTLYVREMFPEMGILFQ